MRVARPEPGVDEHPVVGGEPRLGGQGVVGLGADADEDQVGLDLGAVVETHGRAPVVVLDGSEAGAEPEVHAVLAVQRRERRCDLGAEHPQQG